MKIRKLELVGFKSFKDRTSISFDDGITGIVGPNGCGKSNIVDALVWVMGEQSSKHLRGTSMEDVIFGGSQNYAPMGFAEVSLTLENDGGPFPAKWSKHSEVMVTRRLHRSGESEYFINKEPSRLKDIVDIFMDTGAGSRGFSIVEQGQIGKIVTSKPDDRRTLIEEAAGITKFKVRKRESQRKLEATDQNLIRLNDIIGELRRQLESLQRQAKRAERYKELKNQAQDLDLWLSSVKYQEIKNELDGIAKSLETAKLAEVEGQAQYATKVSELQQLRLDLLELERKVNQHQGEHFDLTSQVQRKESNIKLLEVEIENTKRNEELAGTLKAEIAARVEILSRDLDHLEKQQESLSLEFGQVEIDAQEKAKRAQEHLALIKEKDESITTSRRELLTLVQALTAVEVRFANSTVQGQDLTHRHNEAEKVNFELEAKRAEFEGNKMKAFNSLESQRQMQLAIMQDVENFEVNLKGLQETAATNRVELENFKDEFNKVSSRLYSLEALSQNFEGLHDGVRQVMTWQRERFQPLANGGFELVADIVEVPPDYERAFESALGDRLQCVISPMAQNSVAAVQLLKEQHKGRSSFINSDLVGVKEYLADKKSEIANEPGFKAHLKDLLSVSDTHRDAVNKIFDDIVVVDSLQTALDLRARFQHFSFVTADGDYLEADGTLSGGSLGEGSSGLLAQKREIKELSLKKEELSGKVALATASLGKLEEQIKRVTKDLEEANRQSFEQEIQILEKKKDLERAETELKNVDEAIRKQKLEVDNLIRQVNVVNTQIAESEASINELRGKKEALEISSQQAEVGLAELQRDSDKISSENTQAQVLMASKRQELTSLISQKEKLALTLADSQHQLSRMTEDSSKNSESINTFALQLEEERRDLYQMVDKVKIADENLKKVREVYDAQSTIVRELENQIQSLQTANGKVAHEVGDLTLKQSQAEMNEKYIVDHMLDRYMVNLKDIFQGFCDRQGDLAQAQVDLEDARDKIKKIGEVNLTAIQEYEELSKRYEFLTKQQQDLISSMESLRKVIEKINRICNRRFRDTFDAVNDRFKKVFPVLFGGGLAELILVESVENPTEPGVEIMAQPPGKKLQSVTLLSGGEKALTAVSLIFSIFLVKPSPFCLLDEVDAPLDDANVYRFNDLVKEMSKRSQIILVTHNKHTMTINNRLYGVTMEDPGVSKMVSVNLNS